jgi:hypothetical protein
MNITQISTSSSQTTYMVDNHILFVGIIAGEKPCLSFRDNSFSEEYPIKDKRWVVSFSEWAKNSCYPHQIDQNPIQGPTYDVLPEGIETIRKFIDKYLPLKRLREERIKEIELLPVRNGMSICSRKFLDRENKTKVHFEIRINRFSPVVACSKVYGGRCEKEIQRLAPLPYKKYADYANPIFDSANINWENLTDEQYNTIVSLLREIKEYNQNGR